MNRTKKLVFSALCLALCLVLPFLTANNMALGNMLSLIHLPVLLCGFVCGWPLGLLVGFLAPLLRSVLLSAPPMVVAVPMAFELAVYGLVTGLLYHALREKKGGIYLSLVPAMVLGRIAGGCVKFAMLGLGYVQSFTFTQFISAYVLVQWPAIVIQLVLIPLLVTALDRAKLTV